MSLVKTLRKNHNTTNPTNDVLMLRAASRIEQLEAVETAANTLLSRCDEQWSEDLIFSKRVAFQKLREAALTAKEPKQ